jgi:transposase-like protein
MQYLCRKKSTVMDCPKCKSRHHVKDGTVRGRQRYKCGECHYRYTVERKSDVKTARIRRLALALYLEGLGFRRIGRILKISYGTVYSWIRQWNVSVLFPRGESAVTAVELRELLAYVESKKADGRHGLLLMDLENETSLMSICN